MSNSNYSIGLQLLNPVHTAYCGLHNVAENWSRARDVNGRDRDETETRPRRLPPKTETRRYDMSRDRLETETSRPRPQPCAPVKTVRDLAIHIDADLSMVLCDNCVRSADLFQRQLYRCWLSGYTVSARLW